MKKTNPFYLNKLELCLLILGAVALACAFENINIDIFIWGGFIPLFFVINKKSPKEAFYSGFSLGLLFYIMTIYWLVYTISHYGKINVILSFFIFLLLVLYLALFFGIFAYLYKKMQKRCDTFLLAPVIWVALEYLRTYLISGFPWVLVGYSLYKRPILTQFADITGVYGQSFLVLTVNAVLFRMILYFKGEMKRKYIIEVAASLVILLLIVIYGVNRLQNGITDSGETVNVGLTQGNVDQDIKWDDTYRKRTMELYTALTHEAAAALNTDESHKRPTLIVWPETAAPFYMQSETNYRDDIIALAKDTNAYILTGGLAYGPDPDDDNGGALIYNSAFLISPKDAILGRYDKVHLVPFGEYVPIKKVLFFVNKITDGVGDFSSGDDLTLLTMNDSGVRLATLICYEAIFPDLVRRFVHNGADILINITNDAWFGNTSAPHQHLSMAAFRAVENKRYMIRAANTGISSIIDPFGRVLKKTGLFEKTYITGEVKVVKESTLYSRYGDIFAQIVSGLFIVMLIFSYRKKA